MTSRERTLAFLLLGLILLGVGGGLGYMFIYSPLQDKKAAAEKLDQEISDLSDKATTGLAAKQRFAEVRRQSLPADENFARAQYKLLLERLLRQAGIGEYKIPESRKLTSRPPVVPEMAPKKPAYVQFEFKVDASNITMWQAVDFLREFYQTELLHQITYINLIRMNKTGDGRNGLDMHLTIEAIIIDGAEARRTLLAPPRPTAVPGAVAAAVGGPGLELVSRTPDLARRYPEVKPGQPAPAPVLATRPRDYSYVAWKDIFYGVLPDYVPPKPPPFELGRLSDVALTRDEKPGEQRLRISGDGSVGAKVVATATGGLLREGELKVDPKTYTISIPGVATEDTPDDASSTVTVVAVSADGSVTKKGSFKVTAARKPYVAPPPPGVDIASAIKMPILSGRSDGTRKAVIFDAANPFKYEVVVDGKLIEVTKFWQATGKNWRKDRDYDEPPGMLVFTDDFSATKRRFKVVAFEEDGLILSEFVRPEPKEAPKGGFGGKGGFGRPGGARQGPGDPLAAVAGNVVTATPVAVYYRWTQGKSLADLEKLKPEEAKDIQKRVAADGPIVVASAAGN